MVQGLPDVRQLPAQACMRREVKVPESVRGVVAFFRVWCLVSRCSFLSGARLPVPFFAAGENLCVGRF